MDLVEAAIDAKQETIRAEQARGYAIVKRFIDKNKLMHHGGTAINELLADKHKFIGPKNTIDYDVFARLPSAKQLISLLYKVRQELDDAGYSAWFKPALHAGTQKVWAYPKEVSSKEKKSYPEILDATVLNDLEFRRLQELSALEKTFRRRNMLCVPTAYIKMTAHLEFSRPQGYIERWRKVYPRSAAIYERFPSVVAGEKRIPFSNATTAADGRSFSALRLALLPLAKQHGWLVLGHEAVKRIAAVSYKRLPAPPRPLDLLVDSLRGASKILTKAGFHVEPATTPNSALFPPNYAIVSRDGTPVSVLYESDFCYCFNKDSDGLLVGCPDLVLRFMYSRYIAHPAERPYLRLLIDGLNAHLATCRNKGLSTRFVVPCIGTIV